MTLVPILATVQQMYRILVSSLQLQYHVDVRSRVREQSLPLTPHVAYGGVDDVALTYTRCDRQHDNGIHIPQSRAHKSSQPLNSTHSYSQHKRIPIMAYTHRSHMPTNPASP